MQVSLTMPDAGSRILWARGYSSMVEPWPSKPDTRVRFPLPAHNGGSLVLRSVGSGRLRLETTEPPTGELKFSRP